MPSVLIEPEADLHCRMVEIPIHGKIPNFTSRLFFFDHFILPARKMKRNHTNFTDDIENLFVGEQVRFLQDNGIGWVFATDRTAKLGDACLQAKEEYEGGNFRPLRRTDLSKLNKSVAGTDVFVSDRLSRLVSNSEWVLTLDFVDGIPIPHNSFSPNHILEFKEKRYSEFRNFWNAIGYLAANAELLALPNKEEEIRKGIASGLNDLTAASAETFGTRIRDAISLTLTPAQTTAFLGAIGTPTILEQVTAVQQPHLFEYYLALGVVGVVRVWLNYRPATHGLSQTAKGMSYLSNIYSQKK